MGKDGEDEHGLQTTSFQFVYIKRHQRDKINHHNGTRMVKDGEDEHGLQTTSFQFVNIKTHQEIK